MPKLRVCPDEGEPFFFNLPDAPVSLGRGASNELVINDKYCSDHHASIYPVQGGYAIRDLGSRNGTLVNASRVDTETELYPGDEIQIGQTRIFFDWGGGRVPHGSGNIWAPKRFGARGGTAVALVDNRVFMLGLNELYRTAMKTLESSELLRCARAVAAILSPPPGRFPIEGYYGETAQLKEYFGLMRALQELDKAAEVKVKGLPEFQYLVKLTRSSLFGLAEDNDKLFPRSIDPLAQALIDCHPSWDVALLVSSAHEIAIRDHDRSLVGLAALTRDAVVLTATRESTVLYAKVIVIGIEERPEVKYEWEVDDSLAEAANDFIGTFNGFVPGALPRANAANAEAFYRSYSDSEFIGRCVRIGSTPDQQRHYHWAIAVSEIDGDPFAIGVDEFWGGTVWTTEKYRQAQGDPSRMRLFSKFGVPESWKLVR